MFLRLTGERWRQCSLSVPLPSSKSVWRAIRCWAVVRSWVRKNLNLQDHISALFWMLLAPATSPSSYIYIKQPLKHSNADFRRRLPWQWSSHQALKQHISKNHRKCHEVLTFDLCLFLKNRRWGDVLLFKHSQNWCDWNWEKKDKLIWCKQSWTDLKMSTCWQKMNKNNK